MRVTIATLWFCMLLVGIDITLLRYIPTNDKTWLDLMALPSVTPNLLGDDSLSTFDVLVIGSGASGATVARTLAKAGQTVLVLEAGPNYFPALDDPAGLSPPLFANDEHEPDARLAAAPQLLRRRHLSREDPLRVAGSASEQLVAFDAAWKE